ncbi:MAG: dTDP-4-dehydrorhamnose 3,5-epimerase [Magnetococcus sp. DMHC-8]
MITLPGMQCLVTPLSGVYVLEPEPLRDERGLFARTHCLRTFEEQGLVGRFVQCSTSFNRHQGTLRGLHYQAEPKPEVKLVRCTRGAVFDVAVDVRPDSPSCGRWFGVTLTADNRRSFYLPTGVAHGFQTLVDDTELFYQISEFYVPELSRGVRWDDPQLAIDWPDPATRIMSDRDRSLPLFDDIRKGWT